MPQKSVRGTVYPESAISNTNSPPSPLDKEYFCYNCNRLWPSKRFYLHLEKGCHPRRMTKDEKERERREQHVRLFDRHRTTEGPGLNTHGRQMMNHGHGTTCGSTQAPQDMRDSRSHYEEETRRRRRTKEMQRVNHGRILDNGQVQAAPDMRYNTSQHGRGLRVRREADDVSPQGARKQKRIEYKPKTSANEETREKQASQALVTTDRRQDNSYVQTGGYESETSDGHTQEVEKTRHDRDREVRYRHGTGDIRNARNMYEQERRATAPIYDECPDFWTAANSSHGQHDQNLQGPEDPVCYGKYTGLGTDPRIAYQAECEARDPKARQWREFMEQVNGLDSD